MALPGFRPSVQLSEDPPRLTDKTSGRTLTISRGEARLLSLYDGVKNHEQLAHEAQAAGFPVEPSHVAGLLERVAHAGFMSEPPPESLSTAQELETSSDIVPSLRPDLKIQKSEKSPGLMEVSDPTRGQTFSLYDFEVSIARMLNGKRTAAQIIDAAAKIGIPVSLESLRKFLKQLRAYHFVLETPVEPVRMTGGTWSPRSQWKPEVRELFQSALRKFRAGKADDATDYIVALLQIDPDNGEARELQQRINAKLDEAPETQDFTFDELHGGADAAPEFIDSAPEREPSADAEILPRSVTGTPSPIDSFPPAPPRSPASFDGAFPPAPARTPTGSQPAFAAPRPPTGPQPAYGSPRPPTGPQPAYPPTAQQPGSATDTPAFAAPVSAFGARPPTGSQPAYDAPPRTFSPPAGSPAAWEVRGPSLENPIPPLNDELPVTTSGVRRKMFDSSGAELTDEPSPPDLGEPLHLKRTPTGEQPKSFEPELINLRTTTGEQRVAVDFAPERIETGAPESAADAAAAQAEGIWAPPPKRKTMPPRPAAELEDEAPPRRRRSKAPLILGVLALAGIGGAAAFPVPTQGHATCQLVETEAAKATAPADVKLRALLVNDGDPVEKGKPIATLDSSEIEARIKEADAKTAALTEELAALDAKVNPKLKAKAEAALAKAMKPMAKLEASDKRLLAQKAKFEGPDVKPSMKRKPLAAIAKKLKDNEKARAKAQKAVTAAEKTLKKVTFDAQREPLLSQLSAVKINKESAERELADQSILAPESGTWRGSDKAAGSELKSGEAFGSITTPATLGLISTVKVVDVTLVASNTRRQIMLKDGAATIANADGALKPGACALEFDGGKQPLYKRYLK